MLVKVTDRDGKEYELSVSPTGSLMEVLRAQEWGVTAICGGACACATCHVYVCPEWAERLPRPQDEEQGLINDLEHRSSRSRLSCQIRLLGDVDGLRVMLAPDE